MRHQLAIAWVVFAYLVLAVAPTHFWLDAGEITAAGAELGVMHPPGVPGYAHLLRAAAGLPLGSLGFRVGVVSAAFGAATVVMVVRILARRDAHPLTWWGAALWITAGLTFVRHGRVAEIYTFGAFLTVVALWGFDPLAGGKRGDGPREDPTHGHARVVSRRLLGVGAAVWACWCFGDLRLALGPPTVIWWMLALRRGEPWARWTPLVVVMVSMVVLALPLASAREPVVDWGDPDTPGRLWDHLNARAIRVAYADEILPSSSLRWRDAAADSLLRLSQDIGPLGVPLTVLAAVRWMSDARARPLAVLTGWVMVVELLYAVAINPMGGVDRQTGLVLAVLCVLTVATQVAALASGPEEVSKASEVSDPSKTSDAAAVSPQRARLLRWGVGPLVWTMGILPAAWVSLGDAATTRSWMPHAWNRDALDRLPPGALWLTQSDDLSAGFLYARVVEGARPDVVSVPAQHLHKPPPERGDPRQQRPYAAAADASDETARVVAVLEDWAGAEALESPLTGVFSAVPWWAPSGHPPVAVAPPPRPAVDPAATVAESTWAQWRPHCDSSADRHRVARTVGAWARAEVIAGRGRPEALARAEGAYRLVLTHIEPEHVSSLVALGSVEDRLGRTDAAIATTRRALRIEPHRVTALRNLALYLSRDPGGLGEARSLLERALELSPDDPRTRARLEQVCAQLGDDDCP